MPTQNLAVNWNEPTTGGDTASYTLQGRKGTSGSFVQLASGIDPNSSDPQSYTVPKADVDSILENPEDGQTIQTRAIAVGTEGSESEPGEVGSTTVPSA